MSASEQILGNVDDGEAQEPTRIPTVDDAAESSSQESGADAGDGMVDDSATGSAPGPVGDPAPTLTRVPVELLRLITADLDPIGHHSVRLSCKILRAQTDAPPLMSHGDYLEFQRRFEKHSPHKVKSLFCQSCSAFKDPGPSKSTFSDAKADRKLSGERFCIECGIRKGHYDKRDVVINKKKFFACGGCKLVLKHEQEEKAVADVVFTKGYPYRDSGFGKGAEITVTSGGKRWCKSCRLAIAGLGDSGAVKVKQVYTG